MDVDHYHNVHTAHSPVWTPIIIITYLQHTPSVDADQYHNVPTTHGPVWTPIFIITYLQHTAQCGRRSGATGERRCCSASLIASSRDATTSRPCWQCVPRGHCCVVGGHSLPCTCHLLSPPSAARMRRQTGGDQLLF